ncbi:uncharacterized protein LOC127251718 [Andrographis paniculata]|uniref:uncharacterized protein LOC127251718 n=1 Tax=Andrographis paniculata TaxID=175694 RepID=UPI0021E72640|nr:uncharacterized protein LOC127251718 [Andrographis paniculata]
MGAATHCTETMENSPTAIAPLLLRNLLTTIFVHADRPMLYLSQHYKLLNLLRRVIQSTFLFFLSLLPSFLSALTPSDAAANYPLNPTNDEPPPAARRSSGGGGSGVSRALYQLLLIMNDVPVSSRKYEVVRSLAEKLMDENISDGREALREVNRVVLSAAFSRTLSRLELAAVEKGRRGGGGETVAAAQGVREGESFIYDMASLLFKGIGYFGRAAWRYAVNGVESETSGSSAEKMAAEVLWLAQKMAASGCAEEAVYKWASASNLASVALSAEPRLQGSLVKATAFLIKETKGIGGEEGEDATTRKLKMKIMTSWLPLLCCANNGTDAPILSMRERLEVEKILEELIATLEAEEQEWVLSNWLHHYTHCPASDWPNLRSCYTQWYTASRRSFVASTL